MAAIKPLGLVGAAEIAKHIGKSLRATYYMLEEGHIPGAFKFCGVWHLRPETFQREIEKLERRTAVE